MGQRTALTGSSAMTHVTKTTKRKNNATGLDISQFPELCLAIDKAVGAGLLNLDFSSPGYSKGVQSQHGPLG